VKLNRPLDEARRSAVDSARHIVTFVNAVRETGRFEKLELVSTVGVAGAMPGTVPERAFSEPRSFRNSYEAAKAEAESYVLREMSDGLPATIHRPSMVIGNSSDGRIIQFQVFYYLCEFLSGRRTQGVVPQASGIRLDIIPVDYVARAIQISTTRRDTVGRVFHLCSGPSEAPLVNDLSRRVRAFFVAHGRHAPKLRTVPSGLLRAAVPVASRLVPEKMRRTLQSLPHFLAYLDVPQTFANVDTARFFSSANLTVPRVDSYLEAVLSYYLSREAVSTTSSEGQPARGAA
jgi:nucleoside-diphosphate-sugar epimerase